MSYTKPTVPSDPGLRRAWVIWQLRCQGTTLAELARGLRVTKQGLHRVLDRPSARLEKALARRLGLTPRQLFPERFDAHGRRVRGGLVNRNSTTPRARRNGKTTRPASHQRTEAA